MSKHTDNLIRDVCTTDELRFSRKMSRAPLGQKILVINEGGVAIFEWLNSETRKQYKQWCRIPKQAIDEEDDPEFMDKETDK